MAVVVVSIAIVVTEIKQQKKRIEFETFRPLINNLHKMFWRRGNDPVKLALVLASIYLLYNSWSLSDLNIRDDRVNFEKMLMDLRTDNYLVNAEK